MQVRFAAVEVLAITGTASPCWKPRADARKASTDAAAATGSHGEAITPSTPLPASPVSALSATSETPKRTPADAPSSTPWCSAGAPRRGAAIRSVPSASIAASNASRPGSANELPLPCWAGSVSTSSVSPAAVIATPAHWRRLTSSPKIRSLITARSTTPVESTACTVESGASASAATWNSQAPAAIAMPMANQREANSARALRSGFAIRTSGAHAAPRCLQRKPSCVATAQTSASPIPNSKVLLPSFDPRTTRVAAAGARGIGRAANVAPAGIGLSYNRGRARGRWRSIASISDAGGSFSSTARTMRCTSYSSCPRSFSSALSAVCVTLSSPGCSSSR